MVKNMKKRSASENDKVGEKAVKNASNMNKALKKVKVENGSVQKEKIEKGIKKNLSKKLMIEKKKGQNMGIVQSFVKNQTSEVSSDKNKKQTSDGKEEKQQKVKRRQTYKGKQKLKKQEPKTNVSPGVKSGGKSELSAEEIKQKIEQIEKRENLSKTAKRKLATLRKLLRIKEGTYKQTEQTTKKQTTKSAEVAKVKQIQNKEQKNKLEVKTKKDNKKKDTKQGNLLRVKQNDSDDEVEEVEDIEIDNDEEDESVDGKDESVDDDVDNEDDEEDDEDVDVAMADDDDDDDDDDEDEDEDDEDDDDDDDEDEDEDDDDDEEEDKVTADNIQSQRVKEKPKQNIEQEGKKKRYVLFVGNLPYSITNEELKKHFLTNVSQVVDIRIPKKDANTSRGFAYIELANNTDYEKALSLNHSFINGRRINVQYSGTPGNKKKDVAKNFKLQALQKAGKLAGGYNKNNQKFNTGKKWNKQHTQPTKT